MKILASVGSVVLSSIKPSQPYEPLLVVSR